MTSKAYVFTKHRLRTKKIFNCVARLLYHILVDISSRYKTIKIDFSIVARATKQKKGTHRGCPFSPCSYASRPLGLWRFAPCFALQNARGAIFARALASELADALRLIIRGLTAFGGEPPARATKQKKGPPCGYPSFAWWAIRDSNPGPTGYEPGALTN